MTRIPVTYWIGRAVMLTAVAASGYLLWIFVVVRLLAVVDGWISEVSDWADGMNPLW